MTGVEIPSQLTREERLARARQRRAHRASGELRHHQDLRHEPDLAATLSSTQRRFWFVAQLDPEHDPFAVPVAFRLRGLVDTEALALAMRDVVRRHQVLRTRIEDRDGDPHPVVDPDPADHITVRTIAPDEAAGEIQRAAFPTVDLALDQPWRMTVLRVADDEVVVVLTLHHIAVDGWSIGVLLSELTTAYQGKATPELPVQFADVTRYRASDAGKEGSELEYWTGMLVDAPIGADLPTDGARPTTAMAEAVVEVDLDPATVRALRTVMATSEGTSFMTLLAAWHVVQSRWTDRTDTVIGTAVAGRTHPAMAPLIGCFVNTLALRLTSTNNDTVAELLGRSRSTVLDGLAHQHVGFEDVTKAVRSARSEFPTGAGLYDVSLIVHTEPGTLPELPGVEVTELPVTGGWAQNDLALSVHGEGLLDPDSDQITITATYAAPLFAEQTIRRMIGHLSQVVQEFAEKPTRPLGHIDVRTRAERDQAVAHVGSDTPPPPPDGRRLEAIIAEQASLAPDAPAVTSDGVTLTYRELVERAGRAAGALQAAGVRPADRVALLTDRSVDAIVGMLAIWTAGAAYVPIDPMYPDRRIHSLIDGAEVRVTLCQSSLTHRLDDRPFVDVVASTPAIAPTTSDPGDPAYVLYTSGTTGAPKGVVVEHRHLTAYLAGARESVGFDDGWSWATVSTLAADLGLTPILVALTTGGLLHVLGYEQVTDPDQVAQYFADHRIDAIKLVPSHLTALWDESRPTAVLPEELLILAGEGLPWELVDRIGRAAPGLRVHNGYGPTETVVSSFGAAVSAVPPQERRSDRPVPIGRPYPGTRAHVLDHAGRPTPVGVPGELVIAGPTVASGYLAHPELTAERFSATIDPGHPAYRSGDRVRRLPSGLIEFLGRVDDQVKIRGFRVEPGEVARAVADLPGIADAAVIARQHAGRDRLAAYVVAEPTAPPPDPVVLRELLRERLPDHMVPADYVTIDRIPLTGNGKIDRAALPLPSAPTIAATTRRPSSPTEVRVAEAWSRVLGMDEIGAGDDFFDLGGDSFATVKIVRALDGEVSVVDIFNAPTVEAIAAIIDGRSAGALAPATGLLRRLTRTQAVGASTVHLVCVPFGGGSPIAFAPLAAALTEGVVVHGVDLPGHDIAHPDDPCVPLEEVAERLADEILALDGDVVLYGHCLGGALAVRTALLVEQRGGNLLGLVEAATFPAARLPGRVAALWHRLLPGDRLLSDRAYLESLRSLGGFTDELDPQDLRLLMTALRHDSREAEDYYTKRFAAPENERERLDAPVLAIVGEGDRSTQLYEERYAEWRDYSESVDLSVVPQAGHFFVRHQSDELASILSDRIRRWQRGERPVTERPEAAEPEADVRTFLAVAITQLASMIGTGLTSFALGIWILQQTGSIAAFATVSALVAIPAILAMPISGAVADRFDRRRVMLAADAVAGVMTGILIVLIATDRLTLGFIYAFSAVGALAGAFQRPAYLAAVTQLVPKRYLGQANSLVVLGINAGDLVAALVGGTLIGLVGLKGVILVDIATFLTAVVVIVFVRFPNRLFVRREEGFFREISRGWRFIIARRELVAMVVFFTMFNFLFAFPLVLVTPLVLANHSTVVVGAVNAIGGLGALLGAALMALWGGTRRRALGMIGGTIALGGSVTVMGLSPHPVLIGIGLAGVYGALLVLNSHWLALIQNKVGLELQGRVLATNQMLAMAAMPLGFMLVSPLTSWVDRHLVHRGLLVTTWFEGSSGGEYGSSLLVVGGLTVAWGAIGLGWRTLRRMDLTLPEATVGARIDGDKDALQETMDEQLRRAG